MARATHLHLLPLLSLPLLRRRRRRRRRSPLVVASN